MKFTLIILFSTASLVSGLSARAYALDELDDLLSTTRRPGFARVGRSHGCAAVADGISSSGCVFRPFAVEHGEFVGHEAEDASPVSHPAVPKPAAPLAEMNLVPEPSAVALAALALVDFLLFGRKRRWR